MVGLQAIASLTPVRLPQRYLRIHSGARGGSTSTARRHPSPPERDDRYETGEVGFEFTAVLPGSEQPRPATVRAGEIWEPSGAGYHRVEYLYDLIEYPMDRGFLRLVPEPDDGRATRLEVTERVSIFDEPERQAQAAAMLADACAGLSPAETVALRDLLRRWLAAVSDPDADRRPPLVHKVTGAAH